MSSAIWINQLQDGTVASDEVDRQAIYRYADKLDALCRKLGVTPLSEFHDTTDLEANLAPEEPEDEGELLDTWQLMAERGKWFAPQQGILVIDQLLASLRATPMRFGMLTDRYEEVVAELEECREALAKIDDAGARFHLSIVM